MARGYGVDEDISAEGGNKFAAFCDFCGWASRWHHSDEFADNDPDEGQAHPDDSAFDAADDDGRRHVQESHGIIAEGGRGI